MSLQRLMQIVPAQSGVAFELKRGEAVEIVDPQGEQVADLVFYSTKDLKEYFSSGRTLDYNECQYLTTGGTLYSNRSNPMVAIEHDDVGVHDYLLTPCSARMFEILRGQFEHPSCMGNLAQCLAHYGIFSDDIHCTFNAFMNVVISPSGKMRVLPPRSEAGDRLLLRAQMDLVIGLTACSSEASNAGRCKPVMYAIHYLGG
ncbi:MAG: urea carboxylase-associated family protein [Candidatus Eremiobacteraeota bacterium]|nr:urea carboxylase-associated family protein [Candidatus Eremiobacteraeota bacterium]